MSDNEIRALTLNQQRIRDDAFLEFEDITVDYVLQCGMAILVYILVMTMTAV